MKFDKCIRFGKYLLSVNMQECPPLYTEGITNETESYEFCVFCDIDNIYYEKLLRATGRVAEIFKLSACLVLASREPQMDDDDREFGNYHVIFWDKVNYFDAWRIKQFMPVDPITLVAPRYYKYRTSVLRIASKFDSDGKEIVEAPVFRAIFDFGHRMHECSWAHYKFYMLKYDLPKLKLRFDKSEKVFLIDYNTKVKKFVEVD